MFEKAVQGCGEANVSHLLTASRWFTLPLLKQARPKEQEVKETDLITLNSGCWNQHSPSAHPTSCFPLYSSLPLKWTLFSQFIMTWSIWTHGSQPGGQDPLEVFSKFWSGQQLYISLRKQSSSQRCCGRSLRVTSVRSFCVAIVCKLCHRHK